MPNFTNSTLRPAPERHNWSAHEPSIVVLAVLDTASLLGCCSLARRLRPEVELRSASRTEVPICARSPVVPTVIRARHYVLLPRTQIGRSGRLQAESTLVSRSGECQLSFVEVEVLRGVVVHVRERHLALEERIPPPRKSGRALHVRLGLCGQASFERSDHRIELGTHSRRGIMAGCYTRSPMVDDVEGRGGSVEHCGEASARVRQAVEDLDQRQESAHDHVPEHHVEEQLSVCPSRAVAGSGEFFLAGGFEQRMEGRPRPCELGANLLAVAIVTAQCRTDCPFRSPPRTRTCRSVLRFELASP